MVIKYHLSSNRLANGQYRALGNSRDKHAVTPYWLRLTHSVQLLAAKCICLVHTYVLYCKYKCLLFQMVTMCQELC